MFGQKPRRPQAGVKGLLHHPVSDGAKRGRMGEKSEQNSLIGAFEIKGGLQAVECTSSEKKGRERFRQPRSLSGNVFKCIPLITKLSTHTR